MPLLRIVLRRGIIRNLGLYCILITCYNRQHDSICIEDVNSEADMERDPDLGGTRTYGSESIASQYAGAKIISAPLSANLWAAAGCDRSQPE